MKYIISLLALLFLTPPLMAQEIWKSLITETDGTFEIKGAKTVSPDQALALLNEGVQFIDVRRATQFSTSHIPGAINLDVNGVLTEESLSKHINRDQPVAFYCSDVGCYRSVNASAMAISWGYKDVIYYAEGWSKWLANGYPRD